MKKTTKIKSILLASALGVAMLGGGLVGNAVTAKAEGEAQALTYKLTGIFQTTNSTAIESAEITKNEATTKVTQFALPKNGTVAINRKLALEWREGAGEENKKYFSTEFTFANAKTSGVESISVSMDTDSAWATEKDTAANVVKFTKTAEGFNVTVNESANVFQIAEDKAESLMKLSLADSSNYGEYKVMLAVGADAAVEIGTFVNVGAKYTKAYSSSSTSPAAPLKFTATFPETAGTDVKQNIYLHSINGQAFDGLTTKTENDKEVLYVTDNAKPVLVVNEDIDGFLLGNKFALDYTYLDVLKDSVSKDIEYYQYNPDDLKGEKADFEKYVDLTTSVYFMDTQYTKTVGETEVKTTVAKENGGKEFVSIKVKLSDGTYSDEEYDLAWYAGKTETPEGAEKAYIVLDRVNSGATYSHIQLETGVNENKVVTDAVYEEAYAAFLEKLQKNTENVYVGSGDDAVMKIPSVEWLIDDNNGYSNLKFTISYKTPSASTAKTATCDYNKLQFTATENGKYEFKIYAVDKANNAMEYYLNSELVEVSSTNVWEIEEIPAFSFEIDYKGLKVDAANDKDSQRKASEDLDETYTLSGITVNGARTLQKDFRLYKFTAVEDIKASDLNTISYADIMDRINKTNGWSKVGSGEGKVYADYFDLYLTTYAELLSKKSSGVVDAAKAANIKAGFAAIDEVNNAIDKELHPDAWEASDNKFNWKNSASPSFTAAETGTYVIVGDYWDQQASMDRTTAYKVVTVAAEKDVTKGETQWLKNNIISVVLFSIAGVMLILIVVLLLVKPSNETLEDVEEKAAKKTQKKNKK